MFAASQHGEGIEQPTNVFSVSNAALFACGFSDTDIFAAFLYMSFISPGGNSLDMDGKETQWQCPLFSR